MPIDSYRQVAVLLLVSIAAINDLATRRIPNRLLLAGLAGALGLCLPAPAPLAACLGACAGMAAGFAALLPFYLLRGMAAGDVKLMAVAGAYLALDDVLRVVVLTWCVGGAMALGYVVLRGRVRLVAANLVGMLRGATLPERDSAGGIPYGLAIAIATIATLAGHHS